MLIYHVDIAGQYVTVLNFTPDTYAFPIGLVMLTAFSAALIIIEAVRYHYSRKTVAGIDTASTEVEYRKAA